MTSETSTEPQVLGVLERALSASCAASLRAAVKLGLADALGGTPATADDLAAAVGAEPDALRRLLRSLTCYEVFAEDTEGRFVQTEVSRLLRTDAPDGLDQLVLWMTEPWTWELWGRLDESVRTGKDVFVDLHGREFFDHVHTAWPESAEVFDRAMTQASRQSATAIAGVLPLSGARTVADIGGGQGFLLASLLEHHPDVQGILFDRPDVIAGADARLREGGALAERVRLLSGDCREEVPADVDAYVFKNILGMNDEDAVVVLGNVMRTARPGARVIIVENLVDDGAGQRFSTAMDLRMLLTVGGRKHTRQGLVALVERAGLAVRDVRPVNSYQHMIEATTPV
ncbi:methyltransferase [Streptomyces diastatochromogenes]|uniref:Methyltransferase n=1 Tax=Streptomyces diastatochromogenes TaxID=42236 RepID=A0A233SBM9_STRDA|nr:methyltransferase [Streptomyces diastatochromogenes]MCZ0988080.1 methyltransferase [Streptomyces diastatochromogenes]OXY93060.1 methyltransferase [Streptomyces diastatochromogenes]